MSKGQKNKKRKQRVGSSPSLLLHIGLVVGLSVLIVLGIRWGLSEYTHHGVSVRVPELSGKPLSKAIAELEAAGLKYEVVDSTYNAQARPGTVADVVPTSGSAVKPERIVFLRIYAHEPSSISIPWLEGQSARNALARLRGLGFEYLQEKIVASQDLGACLGLTKIDGTPLKAGAMVPKNTRIVVLIGGQVQDTLSLRDLIDGYSDSLHRTTHETPQDEPVDDPDNWFN